MFDINFYRQFDKILEKINSGEIGVPDQAYNELEKIRSHNPIVWNIETTNRCNMSCKMCPRTTKMTRRIEDISHEDFLSVVNQITPHSSDDWNKWKEYCENKYKIKESDEASENHFFLYIISKVIQLHGYGDPLLDNNMAEYISMLQERGFSTYFSCNPANINIETTYRMMEAGLSYIKYSLESVDDAINQEIRGSAANFSDSYRNILKILEYKRKKDLKTVIVITMIDLNRENQQEEYRRLYDAFEGKDVYIYLKSENGLWYRKDYHPTKSVHWSEPCKHPWMSMTIKSNAEVAMCPEDYNNEIILGSLKRNSLEEIWNGKEYNIFRRQHLQVCKGIKCNEECDMKLIGELLSK